MNRMFRHIKRMLLPIKAVFIAILMIGFYHPVISVAQRAENNFESTNEIAYSSGGQSESFTNAGMRSSIGQPLIGRHSGGAVRGFAGQDEVQVVPGRVTLELRQGSTLHRWETTVGFVEFASPETEQGILGHAGCLDYFVITFDGEKHELTIEPNGQFPGTTNAA